MITEMIFYLLYSLNEIYYQKNNFFLNYCTEEENIL